MTVYVKAGQYCQGFALRIGLIHHDIEITEDAGGRERCGKGLVE